MYTKDNKSNTFGLQNGKQNISSKYEHSTIP